MFHDPDVFIYLDVYLDVQSNSYYNSYSSDIGWYLLINHCTYVAQ